jgi:hypothetical protein
MPLDKISERVLKSEEFEHVKKENPYHDAEGKFSSKEHSTSHSNLEKHLSLVHEKRQLENSTDPEARKKGNARINKDLKKITEMRHDEAGQFQKTGERELPGSLVRQYTSPSGDLVEHEVPGHKHMSGSLGTWNFNTGHAAHYINYTPKGGEKKTMRIDGSQYTSMVAEKFLKDNFGITGR